MGSEMCIRDRVIEGWLDREIEVVESSQLGKVARIDDAPGRYVESVSYTHLTLPTSDLV